MNTESPNVLDSSVAAAIKSGRYKIVQELIRSGAIDVNARSSRGLHATALVLAAARGRRRVVRLLLDAGARIDDVDDDGQTACHVAARGGHADVIAILLGHSPKPNLALKDRFDRTSLMNSFYNDRLEQQDCVSLMLVEAGAPLEDFDHSDLCTFACASRSALQALMNRGVAVGELRSFNHFTPLHLVTLRSPPHDLAFLRMLIDDCGVDLEACARDDRNSTCSSLAIIRGLTDVLRCFLQAGANDFRLAHIAAYSKNYECLVLTLAAGADVSAQYFAWLDHDPDTFYALLAAGVDPKDLSHMGVVDPDPARIESARRDIARARLDFVRHRAMQVCVGLAPLCLDALQMCEILVNACGPLARLIAFHHWWKIATTVKHFKN